ncbi:MAG: hypothetical protein LBM18_05695 [Oscillospiraceae bacterium]|jgi:hypothetical protein|nr:hypothetical protein [Oscillospiraceae bacterium]
MLGKLIKYDFKSLMRILIPANIAILGAAILAALSLQFSLRTSVGAMLRGGFMQLMRTLSGLLVGLMFIGIAAACLFITFMVFYRFYKNFISDEGYLTFTLPVKTSQLLWSKLITASIWMLITGIVGLFSLLVFLLLGTSETSFFNTEIFAILGELFRVFGSATGSKLFLELMLFTLVAMVANILHIYLALIIGGVVAQKHKLLAGIGFYFIINVAQGIVSSIVTFAAAGSTVANMESSMQVDIIDPYDFGLVLGRLVSALQPMFWVTLATTAVFSVVFFILSHYLLKNKLNLE